MFKSPREDTEVKAILKDSSNMLNIISSYSIKSLGIAFLKCSFGSDVIFVQTSEDKNIEHIQLEDKIDVDHGMSVDILNYIRNYSNGMIILTNTTFSRIIDIVGNDKDSIDIKSFKLPGTEGNINVVEIFPCMMIQHVKDHPGLLGNTIECCNIIRRKQQDILSCCHASLMKISHAVGMISKSIVDLHSQMMKSGYKTNSGFDNELLRNNQHPNNTESMLKMDIDTKYEFTDGFMDSRCLTVYPKYARYLDEMGRILSRLKYFHTQLSKVHNSQLVNHYSV